MTFPYRICLVLAIYDLRTFHTQNSELKSLPESTPCRYTLEFFMAVSFGFSLTRANFNHGLLVKLTQSSLLFGVTA